MRKCLLLLFVLFSVNGKAQLRIAGKITPSPEWESQLYVIRIDRITPHPPKLIDSVKLNTNGSFSYTLQHDPQGMVYLFRLPQKGTKYTSVTSGTNDNFFLISDEDQRPIKFEAHSDSLFYSAKIQGNSLNQNLLVFRDFKKPVFELVKSVTDSIKLHPDKKEEYKKNSFPLILKYAEKIRNQVIGILDTTKNISFKLEGLYFLMDASFGQLTSQEMKKYVTDISNDDILLVRNTKNGKDAEAKRTGINISNFALVDLEGNQKKLDQINAQYKVIDFWASWCGPCRYANKNQLPVLNKFLESKKIPLISITIDKDLKKWKEAVKKDAPVWAQFSDPDLIMSKTLNIEGVPQYLVVDNNNLIVYETSTIYAVEVFLKEKL